MHTGGGNTRELVDALARLSRRIEDATTEVHAARRYAAEAHAVAVAALDEGRLCRGLAASAVAEAQEGRAAIDRLTLELRRLVDLLVRTTTWRSPN